MLVLTRRKGEQVMIGDGLIVVEVLEIGPQGQVKLGFQAPRGLPIHRAEIQKRVDAEKGVER